MSADTTSERVALPLVYLALFSIVGAFYFVLQLIWGEYVLLDFDRIWGDGLVLDGLAKVWFIFVWAGLASVVLSMVAEREYLYGSRAVEVLDGWWVSLNAGVFEELIYRWLWFSIAMITIPFFDTITFGLVGWLYIELLVPLANWATFHALEQYLIGSSTWVLGAAIVSANVQFRDDHTHHGFLGKINVWFIGMVMFYLALNYGLLTAIVAHVLYDMIVFTVRALRAERSRFFR